TLNRARARVMLNRARARVTLNRRRSRRRPGSHVTRSGTRVLAGGGPGPLGEVQRIASSQSMNQGGGETLGRSPRFLQDLAYQTFVAFQALGIQHVRELLL